MKAATTLTAAIRASTAPIALAAAALAASATPAVAQSAAAADQRTDFDIPAQPLSSALLEYSRQTGIPVAVDPARVEGKRARAIKGRHTPTDALLRMVAGSGLAPQRQALGGFTLVEAPGESEGDAGRGVLSGGDVSSSSQAGISEILVVGSRSQNVDIRRTQDDPQPYVVINGKELEQSGVGNLEQFFRSRLPMAMDGGRPPNSQSPTGETGIASNLSSINLRGLGAAQTLVLIDGRRAPRVSSTGLNATGIDLIQADVNGIPISAIERIEILPSTAGGIYGGGAVGGVINIIRKKNYRGLSLQTSLDGTFRGGGEAYRLDLTGGGSVEGGKTTFTFALSHAATRPLYLKNIDERLWRAGRELLVLNNPTGITAYNITGSTPNIAAASVFDSSCLCTRRPALRLDPAFGGATLSSSFTFAPSGYRGAQLDGVSSLIANAGLRNLELPEGPNGKDYVVYNGPIVRSANLSVKRKFSQTLELYIDATIGQNLGRTKTYPSWGLVTVPANAANNPFQQDVEVRIGVPAGARDQLNKSSTLAARGGGDCPVVSVLECSIRI